MKRVLHLLLAVMALSLPGCGSIKDALAKFQKAIDEVANLREAITKESGKWREQVDKSQMQLTKDVKDVINNDLRDNVDKTIQTAGMELRCNIDFAEQKLLTYLRTVEVALIAKRDEIKKAGKITGRPEEIIAQVIKASGHVPPHVCHATPSTINFVATNAYGQAETFKTERVTEVDIVGFALKRPSDDTAPLELRVEGPGGVRPLTPVGEYLVMNSTYKLVFKADRLSKDVKRGDAKAVLHRGGENLTEINFRFGPAIGPPPLPPKIVKIILWVGTSKDDKDREITFHYTVHRKSDGKQVGGISVGGGQVWDDDKKPQPSWRDFDIPINKADRFTEADRLGYRIHVRYESSDGDPRWIGRLRADAAVDGKKEPIAVLGETGDFEMGHHRGHPERVNRDFDFNK